MSIYPVQLAEWFPPGDEMHDTLMSIISVTRCHACNKRCKFRKAVGYHSIPWGNGDLYCSWKCLDSGKVAKPDKRQLRKIRRKYGKIDFGTTVNLDWLLKS